MPEAARPDGAAFASTDWIDALGKISASVDRALDLLSDENIGGVFVKDLTEARRGLEALRRQMESASIDKSSDKAAVKNL